MTAVLLDTNALLWLGQDPDRLSDSAMEIIGDASQPVFVSVASAWEIAVKTRSGRLHGEGLLSGWTEWLAAMSVTALPIEVPDAITAGSLNWDHGDPFDRMIVAQAVRRGLTIATSDQAVLAGALTPVVDTRRGRR
ncbi:MAG: type II toxin-antitoxin system VapC family toxin [Gordonia sp. (in: high G+C Gram-positive bacteria)]|uniref:type II toxin-antitoxin system VapC family toxin n=1 Tax=Gordonia sp. (in: high G+C Gram-positive bacteria) TaxID=84139 RepID=UPI0039E527D3